MTIKAAIVMATRMFGPDVIVCKAPYGHQDHRFRRDKRFEVGPWPGGDLSGFGWTWEQAIKMASKKSLARASDARTDKSRTQSKAA